MARSRAIYGFELGSLDAEAGLYSSVASNQQASIVGNVSLEKNLANIRTGIGSLKLSPASGAEGYWKPSLTIIGASINWCRFYLKVVTLPSTSARIIAGDVGAYNLRITPSGTLELRDGINVQGTSVISLTDTTKWYRIETYSDGSNIKLYIDGIQQVTKASIIISNIAIWGVKGETVADTYTAYVDDIIYDDTNIPGDGKAVLLVPISDNARDTLWTGGLGGTTNLWDAVNNTPPSGTASETNLTQIEHAGGAAGTTDRYNANMTSYIDAGISQLDTINAVQGIIWAGEDIATGTKLLSHKIISNPTGTTSGSFDVAATSGALGTFPTGWWCTRAPVNDSPSVVVANSPIMQVVRPETASRVASVCFMGIYVDYSPATTSPPSSKSDFIPAKSSQIVSVNRASFY